MDMRSIQLLCVTLALVVCSSFAIAQANTRPVDDKRAPIVKETEAKWKSAKKWTLDYIDAMPESGLGFKPMPEVRSFAEQMLHLAFWNHGLAEFAGGEANPYGKKQEALEKREDIKTKTALRKIVEESYDSVLAFIVSLDEAKLLEVVPTVKETRLTVLSHALDHQTHHRAQTTIYLRLKGVKPPPEQ
jgi:uncharacterized damage-inducible protein DinB